MFTDLLLLSGYAASISAVFTVKFNKRVQTDKAMFKSILMFLWKLPRTIFNKINECEENFLTQFDENYKSKLGINSIIYFFGSQASFVLAFFITLFFARFESMNGILGFILAAIPGLLFTTLYTINYLKKRLPIIQGRKWWYCIQAILGLWFGFYAIIAPIAILAGLLYAAAVVVIVILVLWIALSIITGDSGSNGKRRWKLDNGDEVEESKGLLGTKHYRGRYGTEYEKDGDKFREKY